MVSTLRQNPAARLFSSIAWKIALIAIGPVVGVFLTVGLNLYAQSRLQETEQVFSFAQNDLQDVENLVSTLSLVSTQISSFLEDRSERLFGEITFGLNAAKENLAKMKGSADERMRSSAEHAESRVNAVATAVAEMQGAVVKVGRSSYEGLTEELDRSTQILSVLFTGAKSNDNRFTLSFEHFNELLSLEQRYRWKRDEALAPRLEYFRDILRGLLERSDWDMPQAAILIENLKKQGIVFNSWRDALGAERSFRDEALGHARRTLAATSALRERAEARMREARSSNMDASQRTEQFSYGSAILAALISIALVFVVGRSIGNALSSLAGAMRKVSDGQVTIQIPSETRRDEVGEMARALGVFRQTIIERERLAAESRQADEDRLRRAEAVEASVATFGAAMERALATLHAASDTMKHASQTLESDSGVLAVQTQRAEQATANASREVASVAVATEQLSKSVDDVARQAVRSTQVAHRAVQQSEHATGMMTELVSEAERIGDVVELIRSIAGQTNLLALNATIEAARAGEAGRGFAVVAAEVKSLANQTAKATEEIVGKISAIQSASSDVSQAIGLIGGILGEMSAIATSVAAAVEEQSSALSAISGNVNGAARASAEGASAIADAGERTLSSRTTAEQVARAAGNISQEAVSLEHVVSTFLNDVRTA
ncbi:Tar Methyl-accepting chemotaxis protein [Rhabdaerophilaceae bacterium]